MIEGKINNDIFAEEKIYYDGKEVEKISELLYNRSSSNRGELKNLYTLLRRYDELCEDYDKCTNNYTRDVLIDRMQILKSEIEQYCIVKYKG